MSAPSADVILTSLPTPLFVVSGDGRFSYTNSACEQFFATSGGVLRTRTLARMVTADSPLVDLTDHARDRDTIFAERGLRIEGPDLAPRLVDASAAPVTGHRDSVVVVMRERSMVEQVGQSESRLQALKPVTGMAAMLAHEIKNPLSGIRGAAQLLSAKLDEGGRELTDLIREEVDRIAGLVDRMDIFAQNGAGQREPVNVHEVLNHVRRIAEAGFGASVTFEERYDPSLPPIAADRSLLVQVFLNLIKNACEATNHQGRVILSTAYRHDLQRVGPEGRTSAHLPIEVCVEDNGPGVPESMKAALFEPFVTARPGGSGLGLALVGKVVADHGAHVECRCRSGSTVFSTRWPVAQENTSQAPVQSRKEMEA